MKRLLLSGFSIALALAAVAPVVGVAISEVALGNRFEQEIENDRLTALTPRTDQERRHDLLVALGDRFKQEIENDRLTALTPRTDQERRHDLLVALGNRFEQERDHDLLTS